MPTYRISQLAERCGVPATTLRFYEDAGLLTAGRTPAGYRVYGEDAVERLAFISSAKLLGLALREIRALLAVREDGVCASVRARMLPLVAHRITETDGRVAALRALADRLAGVHAALSAPAPAGACGPDCGCATTGTPPPRTGRGPEPRQDTPAPRAGADVPPTPTPPGRDTEPRQDAPPVPAAPPAPPGPVGAEPWRNAPAACALGGAELDERTAQWRALVAEARGHEEIPDGVRLSFPAGAELAGAVASLAAAEQGCCAFFDFTLRVTPAALHLEVRAPGSAAGILAALFAPPT